jgi:hypothetical protein
VAVAKKGAPLMRLFKTNQHQPEEDRARDLRLTAIASRYRPDPPREIPPEPQAAESPQ